MKNLMISFLILFIAEVALGGTQVIVPADMLEGSYAPKNYIKNGEFEKNKLNVTDTATIAARSTSSPLSGDASLTIDATTSGQKVKFPAKALDPVLKGQNCQVLFNYSGDATLYKAYVEQGSAQLSSTITMANATPGVVLGSAKFACGDLATPPALVIEATSNSAAAIKVDKISLGEATGVSSADVSGVWQIYTPAVDNITLTASRLIWRRDGPDLLIKGSFDLSSSAAGPGRIYFPDTTMLVSQTAAITAGVSNLAGKIITNMDPNATYDGQAVMEPGFNYVTFTRRFGPNSDGPMNSSAAMNGIYGAGSISVDLRIPISGWTQVTAIDSKNSNTGMTDGGAIQVTADVTAPTKGTVTKDKVFYKRTGQFMEAEYLLTQTTAGTSGSGEYIIALPTGLTADTSIIPAAGGLVGTGSRNDLLPSRIGSGFISQESTGGRGNLQCFLYTSTSFKCNAEVQYSASQSWSSSNYAFGTDLGVSIRIKVPISGWTENQNAPLLVGSVTTPSQSTLSIFHLQFGSGGSFGGTNYCAGAVTCTTFETTAPPGSSVAHDGAGNYTLTVPAGSCSGPLACSMEGQDGSHVMICPAYATNNAGTVVPTTTQAVFSCFSLNPVAAAAVWGDVKCQCRK